jgi:hypothetical protein
MSYDYDEICNLREELDPYVELEGTEIGEACSALIRLSHYPDYISEECLAAVVTEMKTQLEMFKDQCTIVESEETFTRKVRDLDWN